jgi:FtsH-binding integral membrane protein
MKSINNFEDYYYSGANNQPANYEDINTFNTHPLNLEKVAGVYGWMFVGLLISGIVAFITYSTISTDMILNMLLFFIFFGIELALVYYLSEGKVIEMEYSRAVALFLIYSVINGITLSLIFIAYTLSSIAYTFFICAAVFGIMALYGSLTKANLTSAGSFQYMGLVSILIVSIFNAILKNPIIYWIETFVGVMIFLGLTAYDAQKIKVKIADYQGTDKVNNIAIYCALLLYLDFINLMLKLLRLFGKRKR